MSEQIIIQSHGGSNPDDPDGMERRLAMFRRNRELAEHFVSQSVNKDVVVIVFDTTDVPDLLPTQYAAWSRQIVEDGNIPGAVLGFDREVAYKCMGEFQTALHQSGKGDPPVSPIVEKLFQPAPAGHFYYMIVSRGKQMGAIPIPT